jgi:hypothetical protein
MRLRPASPPWPRSVRAVLAATDWTRHPVVDVVTFAPATSCGLEGDRQRIEVHRHREAPDLAVYENAERSFGVERLVGSPSAGTD